MAATEDVVEISPESAAAAQFWAAIATILVVIANCGLVVFAALELRRARRRDARADQRESDERADKARVAEVRASHLAYELLHEFESISPGEDADLEDKLLVMLNKGTLDGYVESLTAKVNELARAAVDATPAIRQAAGHAQVHGLAACRSIHALATAPSGAADMYGRIDARSAAEDDVRETMASLRRMVAPSLVSAREARDRRRHTNSMDGLFENVAGGVILEEERSAARERLLSRKSAGDVAGVAAPPESDGPPTP